MSLGNNHFTSSGLPQSPWMYRLASQLASIKISLDPPSPPHASTATLPHCFDLNKSFSGTNYLQVPAEYDTHQLSSPPPNRRCSLTSITSDNSSIKLSMSSSYQSLLLPIWTSKKCSIDGCDASDELIEQPRNVQVRFQLLNKPSSTCVSFQRNINLNVYKILT